MAGYIVEIEILFFLYKSGLSIGNGFVCDVENGC